MLTTELKPEFYEDLTSEKLDIFSIEIAETMMQQRLRFNEHDCDSEVDRRNEADAFLFLRICAGLELSVPFRLVAANAVQSWLQICLSEETIDSCQILLQGRKNSLLENL